MLLYHKFREIEHEKEANKRIRKKRRERETQKPLSRHRSFNLSCVSYRQNQDAKNSHDLRQDLWYWRFYQQRAWDAVISFIHLHFQFIFFQLLPLKCGIHLAGALPVSFATLSSVLKRTPGTMQLLKIYLLNLRLCLCKCLKTCDSSSTLMAFCA